MEVVSSNLDQNGRASPWEEKVVVLWVCSETLPALFIVLDKRANHSGLESAIVFVQGGRSGTCR